MSKLSKIIIKFSGAAGMCNTSNTIQAVFSLYISDLFLAQQQWLAVGLLSVLS